MIVKIKNIMKFRKLSLICLFLSVPSSFIGGVLSIEVLTFVGIELLIVFIVISFLFWKCPHCNERLPIRFNSKEDIDDNYICPYCNGKF
ncbi:hypothetical protein CLPUN_39150 [Clostridium puniceum]|uniref:Uncharacterized protein n=1 Tax=Clostridium puniceum TaxID=29367 RepID=A0A1S8T9V5_9CLOT|nr:hypothetical protein [Clostridium puniceum]OOM74462.1 hypothetical protein CLPUN_39150 [Clostridium puniceum]